MLPRYAWLGATRRRSVRDVVTACVESWLLDWCMDRQELAVEVDETASAAWPMNTSTVRIFQSPRGCVLTAIDEQQLTPLGSRFAAVTSHTADTLASSLANAAMDDLVARVASRAKLAGSAQLWTQSWPESLTRPEWGALGLAVKLDQIELLIALDRAAVETLSPATVKSTVLEARTDSLQATSISVAAVLDFGEISARDVAGLHVGEVLVSERKLGQGVALRIGTHHVADAAVGSTQNHLAVVLTSASRREENP